ncbi:MAG: SDR family NAD(P)-dependent oxidoreductase [Gemmatimonadaceae bacterium]|nr:SDR family NAD(P)-dependent oxidoreductase [Gemmatimonadaceae bacterium]
MPTNSDSPVWLITGCSTGLGRALAEAVLAKGDRCVVTARNPKHVEDITAKHKETALVLALDVTLPTDVALSVKSAEEKFGRIDVLVNNAGIGYFGSVEESDEAEVRRMTEINFWGLSAMTRAVLPGMRKRKSGHIINVSSVGGLNAIPALAYYNATKFAVEGFSEALSKEVAHLGIKVTIVEPSGFRTDWAGRSANDVPSRIGDYAQSAEEYRKNLRAGSGKQPGDPVRAAEAIIAVVNAPAPPLRLLLGKAAWKNAHLKIDALNKDFDAWRETTEGAEFPEGE